MSGMELSYTKAAATAVILVGYGFLVAIVHKYEQDRYENACIGGPVWYKRYIASPWIPNNATSNYYPSVSAWRYCAAGDHGAYCLAGTVVMGANILTFRLLKFLVSRYVKYLHTILHTVAAILIAQGIRILYAPGTPSKSAEIYEHRIISYVVGLIYIGQLITGFLSFIYVNPNCKIRQLLKSCHDLFGSWVYLCTVSCCISGKRLAHVEYNKSSMDWFNYFALICYILVPWLTH